MFIGGNPKVRVYGRKSELALLSSLLTLYVGLVNVLALSIIDCFDVYCTATLIVEIQDAAVRTASPFCFRACSELPYAVLLQILLCHFRQLAYIERHQSCRMIAYHPQGKKDRVGGFATQESPVLMKTVVLPVLGL